MLPGMTVEIDSKRLSRLAEMTGIASVDQLVEFALNEAERAALMKKVFARKWSPEQMRSALDPAYDLLELREKEKPN
jgi:hypothetical protein